MRSIIALVLGFILSACGDLGLGGDNPDFDPGHLPAMTAPGQLPAPFSGATYTKQIFVSTTGSDANPGTMALPKRNIQTALYLATPGTSIEIRSGTYYENLTITASGTASGPIRIRAYDGALTATINPVSSASTIAGWGVDYILIQGLNIKAPSAAGGDNNGIKFGLNVNVPNSYIAIIDNKVTVPADGNDGIKVNQTSHAYILGNWVENAVDAGIDLGVVQFAELGYNYINNASRMNTFSMYMKMGSYSSILHHNYVSNLKFGIWIGQSSDPELWDANNPASPRRWEALNCHAWGNVARDISSSALAFMAAWDSSHTNSISYNTDWKNIVAAPQTYKQPPLECLNNRVEGNTVDQSDYYYNESGQPDTTALIQNRLGETVNGTASSEFFNLNGTLLSTGTGFDTVRVVYGAYPSEILDFNPTYDSIELSGFTYANAEDLLSSLRQVGPHTVLVLENGQSLWLRNIDAATLNSGNFLLL